MTQKGLETIQLQQTDGSVVSWHDFAGNDWESDGCEDVQPSFPYIKIVQATSRIPGAGKHGGEFYLSDADVFLPELECVALVRRVTRALFRDDQEQPTCLSPDGKAPLGGMPEWEGQVGPASCKDCVYSQWGDDDEPPPCKLSNVLLVSYGDDEFAQIRVSGKSLKPLKKFIAERVTARRMPLYAYRLVLTTAEKDEGPQRHWYELMIASEAMSPVEARHYSDLLRAQRERFERGLTDTVEWADDAPAPVDDGWVEA